MVYNNIQAFCLDSHLFTYSLLFVCILLLGGGGIFVIVCETLVSLNLCDVTVDTQRHGQCLPSETAVIVCPLQALGP